MESDFANFLLKFSFSFDALVFGIAELLPIFVIAFLFPLLICLIVYFFNQAYVPPFYLLFFSFMGVLVAYVVHLSQETILENLLPSFIISIGMYFEFYSKARQDRASEIQFIPIYFGGLIGAILFMISSRYFALIFGKSIA